jgi:Tol biopolymer transport system component
MPILHKNLFPNERSVAMRLKLFAAILFLILLAGITSAEQAVKLEAPRPVAAGDLDVLAAAWSPDGSILALTEAKHAGIYLMDPSTGQINIVTGEAQAGYRFAWSPDGRQIAYKTIVDAQAMTKAVKLADLETGQIRQISGLSNDVGVPTWFSDGRIGYTYGGNLLIVDQEGNITGTVPDIASNVATVSYDGQWILYNDREDQLWAYHLTDGERFRATPDGGRFFNPVWSPTELVAVVNELGGPFYLLDIIAGTLTPLDDGNHYSWSPNGQRIVYDITQDDGHYITAADLYIINPDGTGRTALTSTQAELEMYPTWSATDRIACSQPDGGLFVAKIVTQ